MRTLIILILLSSCDATIHPKGKIITSKAYSFEPKKKLMPCICMYEFWENGNNWLFEDSCNKYNIGDTIK